MRSSLLLAAVVAASACDGDPLSNPPPIDVGGEGEGDEGEAVDGEGEGAEGEGEPDVPGDCPALAGASFGPAIDLVVPRSRHAAVVLDDGRVMLIGGEDDTFGQIKDVEIIDVVAGSSSAGPELNQQRYEHAAVTLDNGDVVVAGGFGEGGHLSSIEVFDGTAWTVVGDLDQPRAGLSGFVIDGVAVFFGGSNTTAIPSTVVSVDEAGTVAVLGGVDVGQNRQLSAVAQQQDGSVVVAGGFFTAAIDTATVFDVDSSAALPRLPAPVRQAAAGVVGAGVVVVGGLGGVFFDEVLLLGPTAWTVTGHLATPRASPEVVAVGACLAVCGGIAGEPTAIVETDTCEGIDADGRVLPMASLPAATFSFSLTALPDGRALFAGGTLEASHVAEARVLTPQ